MISQEELKKFTYDLLEKRGVTIQAIADIVMSIQQPYIPDLTMDECLESVQAVLEKTGNAECNYYGHRIRYISGTKEIV